jgi:glycosyltransferase involved in cell wall biosynthesis
MSSTPDLSVVICSLNGAAGVDRCLAALAQQDLEGELETILVDDGSTDDTSAVGHRHGVRVIRHPHNRGLSAARNSGVRAATAPVVGFLDDDCVPEPDWARELLGAHGGGVLGVGGPVCPESGGGFIERYLERCNPLGPLEIELADSEALLYRLRLYVRRMWGQQPRILGRREVFALVGANMSFRRQPLLDVGLFDERFTFGAEELDLSRRLAHAYPEEGFVFQPEARVRHRFEPSLRDTLRRARSYGRGSARMFRKWPGTRPTFFPYPFIALGLLALGLRRRPLLVAAVLAPHAMFPGGLRRALEDRTPEPLADPYIQLAQEAYGNVGFVQGLWQFRRLVPEPSEPAPFVEHSAPEPEVAHAG